jgi:hypothetical protein
MLYLLIATAWVVVLLIILQILGGNRQLERKLNKKNPNKENF